MTTRRIKLYPHQKEIIKSEARHIAIFGGVGSGKSFILRLKGLQHSIKYAGSHGIMMRKSRVRIEPTIWKDFIDEFGDYIRDKNLSKYIISLHNGSQISCLHAWDDVAGAKHLDGANCSWFVISQAEDVPEISYRKMTERCRRKKYSGGIIPDEDFLYMAEGNPRGKGHWIWRDWAIDAKKTEKTEMVKGKEVTYFTYEKEDHLLILIPSANYSFVPGDYLENISKGRSDRDKVRYVQGMFDTYTGAIYDNWNRDVHLIKPIQFKPELPNNYVRILGIDWGIRDINPTAALWCIYDRDNDIYYFYREHYQGSMTAKQQAETILELNEGEKIDFCFCDPSMWNRVGITPAGEKNDQSPISIADEMQDTFGYEILMLKGNNNWEIGRERVYQQFSVRDGVSGAYVFDRLSHFTHEIENYVYLESYEDKEPRQDVSIEKPRKKDDHEMDIIRYIMMSKHLYDKNAEIVGNKTYWS